MGHRLARHAQALLGAIAMPVLVLVLPAAAHAATATWTWTGNHHVTQASAQDWDDALNWSDTGTATGAAPHTIASGEAVLVSTTEWSYPVLAGDLVVDSGGTFELGAGSAASAEIQGNVTNDGTIEFDDSTNVLDIDAGYTQDAGSLLDIGTAGAIGQTGPNGANGGASSTLEVDFGGVSGDVTLHGGTLQGFGAIHDPGGTVTNDGATIHPGFSHVSGYDYPGTIRISNAPFTMHSGTLQLDATEVTNLDVGGILEAPDAAMDIAGGTVNVSAYGYGTTPPYSIADNWLNGIDSDATPSFLSYGALYASAGVTVTPAPNVGAVSFPGSDPSTQLQFAPDANDPTHQWNLRLIETTPPTDPSGVQLAVTPNGDGYGLTASWSASTDGTGSGVLGYAYAVDTSAAADGLNISTSSMTGATATPMLTGFTAGTYYVHLRTFDHIGNPNSREIVAGPFYVGIASPTPAGTSTTPALASPQLGSLPHQTLTSILRSGIVESKITCNQRCVVHVKLTIPASLAKRLGILGKHSKSKAPVVVGTGTVTVKHASTPTLVKLKLTLKARHAFSKLKSISIMQTFSVTAGNQTKIVRHSLVLHAVVKKPAKTTHKKKTTK